MTTTVDAGAAGAGIAGAPYPPRWETDAVLADGSTVHVRPILPTDAAALMRFHERLGPETVRRRFFSPHPRLSDKEVTRFTTVDHRDRVAFVGWRGGEIAGIGRYDRVPGTDEAEVAFVVDDALQGRGLGTLLLEYLASAAAENGIRRFSADTLFENQPMLRVFREAGFRETTSVDHGVVTVHLDIRPTETLLSAIERREWSAAVASVRRLLRPTSIAVVGAGREPGGIGHTLVRNLVAGGFTGPVHPVNPRAATIAGLPASASVAAIPGPVDLALVAVPAALVAGVVDDCAAKGVKGLVVISSGFGETGADGAALEREVLARAHRGGMRLIGPNCMGVINTAADVRMQATFAADPAVAGRLAFASQSGALGIAMLQMASSMGLGLSSFVSMGNKSDVSSNDLLRYWEQDDDTSVILLYLESFGNPRAFSRIARRVSQRKPIVAVKSGRTAAGSRAAASHTAAMATPDTAVDALFHQTGVIRVDTLEELFATGALLAAGPLPAGARVAIVGNAGGAGILAADAAEAAGLRVAPLSEATRAAILAVCPTAANTANPVDLGAGARAGAFTTALQAAMDDEACDSVVLVYAPVTTPSPDEVAVAMAGVAQTATKPMAAVMLGMQRPPQALGDAGVPVFAFPEPAVRALGRVEGYARWRERPAGAVPTLDRINAVAARAVVDSAMHRLPETGGWLDAAEVTALLQAYSLSPARSEVADTPAAAAAAAERVGLPVALKAASGAVLHKSDVGGVVLGLTTPDDVRAAFADMRARLGDAMGSALVQHMVEPGVEVIVGVVADPLFGPLVMVGSGGVTAEVFADRAFRVLPLTDRDVHELVRSIRGAPLLLGYRGAPPTDIEALEDVVLRVARLAEDVDELGELDLNPVIVSPSGAVVVDARLRLRPRQPRPALDMRHLRVPG